MNLLTVSPSPHIRGGATTTGIMRDVLIALSPAAVASVIIFGFRSLAVIAMCVCSCVVFEWAFEKAVKRAGTIGDLSAAVTGVLLAFNLPVTIPLWQCIVGSFVAIVVVKQLFGGIGKNFANPAITARIFMFLAFTGTMSRYIIPKSPDGITAATPLMLAKTVGEAAAGEMPSLMTLFLGSHGGVLGETCALALLLGLIYLLVRKVIGWETPVVFAGVVFILSFAFGRDPVAAILSGGLLLGAIFMATDYVTAPMTFWGRFVFGAGCGVLTVIIRQFSSYPEGVSFSILIMNIITPYLNRATAARPLGGAK